MTKVTRYHPLLVALHWALALGITVSLARSFIGLAHLSNADPAKLVALRLHMTAGMVISIIMLIRLVVRLNTAKPPVSTTEFSALDPLAAITHYSFYALVFGMAVSGLATALLAGLFPIVYGHSGTPLPHSFLVYPTRIAHGIIGWALAALIALHIVAVIFHQFVRRKSVLRRMWFGRRAA
ncbi:MAG TPA: cytochrome b/b6 domain-containing protein [Chthoniobacterales bacterium]